MHEVNYNSQTSYYEHTHSRIRLLYDAERDRLATAKFLAFVS